MDRRIDITGQRFGRLVALRRTDETYARQSLWLCQCDCGQETVVRISYLRCGKTRSCGCLQREKATALGYSKSTHGHARPGQKSDTYKIWCDMKKRCNNPNQKTYRHYGGRGIKVCAEWNESFASFLADMGERPGPEFSLERIEHDGDYEPSNCVWTTWTEQNRNRRNNRIITFDGESKCMSEWAEGIGISAQTLWGRLKRGWPLERALTQKPRS